jgi:hypothetical protein
VSFLEEAKEMKSPNSCVFVELKMDEMPFILGIDSLVFCSLIMEVSPFHVIFNLNGVLVATHFNKGGYGNVHLEPSFLGLD